MSKSYASVLGHYKTRTFLTPEEETALFEEYRTEPNPRRQAKLLDKIVCTYQPLVPKEVRAMSGYGVDPEELVSEANMALVEAAQRFDPYRSNGFAAFAKKYISGRMLSFIGKNKFPVNVNASRDSKKLFYKLRKKIVEETHRQGVVEMTYEVAQKVAEDLGVTVEQVYTFEPLFRSAGVSLNAPIGQANNGENGTEIMTRQDMIEDDRPNPEEMFQADETTKFQSELLKKALEALDPRERAIFEGQVLAPEDEVLTLEDLSVQFGISKERVRQLRVYAHEIVTSEIKRLARKTGSISTDMYE